MKSTNSFWIKLWKACKHYVFIIIPVVFLIISILVHFSIGKFYMGSTDPEYLHLLNGLNLSVFNLAVSYIDHPGTTIEGIYAISAHIVNITQPSNSIITNALNNPEDFIHGASILLITITSLIIFLLGFYTYKYTGNILLAFLMQLMPFSSMRILLISGRLIPEAALIGLLLILSLLIIKFVYDENRDKNTKIYLIGFAIVGGLGMAGKLLYLPFLIIPLFLLPTNKIRLKYLFYTLIAIVIFAFPLVINPGKSWTWFSNMFMHSGKWGSGDNNILDISVIPDHLHKIFNMDKALFYLIGLAILQLILFYSIPIVRKGIRSKLLLRSMIAVLISILFSVVLITKHFAFHYFVPSLVFKAFIVFLMASLIVNISNLKRLQIYISSVALLVMVGMIIPQTDDLKIAVQHNKNRSENLENRSSKLKEYTLQNNPLIISSNYRGSPFIQSALVDGFLQSGHLKSTFIEHLTEKYPNTFFYVNWSDHFYFWDQFVDAKQFVNPETPVYLFIGEGKEENLKIILNRIEKDLPGYYHKLNVLHHFTKPDEYFYEITFTEKKNIPDV